MGEYGTRADVADVEPPPASFPGGGAYLGAALLPLLGVIFAIVAFARGKVGPGFALLMTSAVAWFVWALVWIGILASGA